MSLCYFKHLISGPEKKRYRFCEEKLDLRASCLALISLHPAVTWSVNSKTVDMKDCVAVHELMRPLEFYVNQ